MSTARRRPRLLALAAATAAVAVTAPVAAIAGPGAAAAPEEGSGQEAGSTLLVEVPVTSYEERERLQSLGLDLTEHGDEDGLQVVLHSPADAEVLRAAGFDYSVLADLVELEAQRVRADQRFALENDESTLPSGRTAYRLYSDYQAEMEQLAAENPTLVRRFELPERTANGRPVFGLEIATDVADAEDGRPTFLMMGIHHAREWPSGEHTMEFAHQLVDGVTGGDARITEALDRARVVVVPVVNPDGFLVSRGDEAGDVGQQLAANDDIPLGAGDLGYLGIQATGAGGYYKRKNCAAPQEGDEDTGGLGEACGGAPGGENDAPAAVTQLGVDLNRNYAGFWGGPGAGTTYNDETFRGPGPFSEPETRNVRALVSGTVEGTSQSHVTTLITNHTFSNLVLRPPGIRSQGLTPDEDLYRALGASQTSQNGYLNQKAWELYDTTGTTEDWSYYTTGGFGFTYEIGAEQFHPPFEDVVAEYNGTTDAADGRGDDEDLDDGSGPDETTDMPEGDPDGGGVDPDATDGGGNREAYLRVLEATAAEALTGRVTGTAPAGTTLRMTKTVQTPSSPVMSPTGEEGDVILTEDVLSYTLDVGEDGEFSWVTNPSTRPLVAENRETVLDEEPARTETFTVEGGTVPGAGTPVGTTQNFEFLVEGTEERDLLEIRLPSPSALDDYDVNVYLQQGEGEERQIGSSGSSPGEEELVEIDDAQAGTYRVEVVNYAAASPAELTASLFGSTTTITPGLVEQYQLQVLRGDEVVCEQGVTVARGETTDVDLCSTGDVATRRLAGGDRFGTAVRISQEQFEDGSDVVYVARGNGEARDLADAVAAGSLTDGPVLLVPSEGDVSGLVLDEVRRLGADEVVGLGGNRAISDDVLTQVAEAAGDEQAERLQGADRFGTAVAISNRQFADGDADSVYLAQGPNPVDAVAGGALTDGPVLLVPTCGDLPQVVADEIERLGEDRVVALGGAGAVCDDLLAEAGGDPSSPESRLAGANRFETAAAIAGEVFPDGAGTVFITRGDKIPDAVAGGTLTAGPVLLVDSSGALPPATVAALAALAPAEVVALGGTAAVSQAVLEAAATR